MSINHSNAEPQKLLNKALTEIMGHETAPPYSDTSEYLLAAIAYATTGLLSMAIGAAEALVNIRHDAPIGDAMRQQGRP